MRPGALDDIPRHLTEIGWDTDLPSLLVIRFMPEKQSFDAAWSSWVTGEMLQRKGYMAQPRVSPWPPFFKSDPAVLSRIAGNLAPTDMQAFQAWCLRRSQVIPRVIVHSLPYVAPMNDDNAAEVRVRPLGLAAGQPKDSQRVEGVGFAQVILLGLSQDADDTAVAIPKDVIARLPPMGVTLETRLRWLDPVHVDGSLYFPGELLSLRLVADRRVLWEHSYAASSNSEPASSATAASSRPVPRAQSDIKF